MCGKVSLAQALPSYRSTLPEWVAAKTLLGPLPQIPPKYSSPTLDLDQLLPSKLIHRPSPPPVWTSEGPLPHTASRWVLTPDLLSVKAVPSKCQMAPYVPTANTSVGPLPQTSENQVYTADGLVMGNHLPLWYSRITPPPPTTNTWVGLLPQIPLKYWVLSDILIAQALPS